MLRGAGLRDGHADATAGASRAMRENRDASQLPQLETANEHGKPQRPASEDAWAIMQLACASDFE
jgi:hypothetical protein